MHISAKRMSCCLSRLPSNQAVLASVSANGASSKQPGAKPQVIHAKRYKG